MTGALGYKERISTAGNVINKFRYKIVGFFFRIKNSGLKK